MGLRGRPGTENDNGADGLRACGHFYPARRPEPEQMTSRAAFVEAGRTSARTMQHAIFALHCHRPFRLQARGYVCMGALYVVYAPVPLLITGCSHRRVEGGRRQQMVWTVCTYLGINRGFSYGG